MPSDEHPDHSATVFFQHIALAAGQQPDWATAEHALARIDADDVDYIDFALGITVAELGSAQAVVQAARDGLRYDLMVLQAALADPDGHGLQVINTGANVVYVAATNAWEADPRGAYGAMLRLGLMYVLDAAGFQQTTDSREAVPEPASPAARHVVSCRPERLRSHAWRLRRHAR